MYINFASGGIKHLFEQHYDCKGTKTKGFLGFVYTFKAVWVLDKAKF